MKKNQNRVRYLNAPTKPGHYVYLFCIDAVKSYVGKGKNESSMAKVICSEAEWRVVDRCVQILGGQGVTAETIVARIWSDMRAFRIYDGPSEVHRWSLARHILKGPKGL